MASMGMEGSVLNKPFDTFAELLLPLYSGPEVVICIGSTSHKYRLPKSLLCTQVPYFADMFKEEHFKEGADLSATLEEIEGVLSIRSFEMLVQWVYLNRIVFGDVPPAEAIALSIEFARLADMYRITGFENWVAEHIKQIILPNTFSEWDMMVVGSDDNTKHLKFEHISSAVLLPEGHAVRRILASAAVKGYFLGSRHVFFEETQGIPDFAVDLLKEIKIALKSLEGQKRGMTFQDPLSGRRINLKD